MAFDRLLMIILCVWSGLLWVLFTPVRAVLYLWSIAKAFVRVVREMALLTRQYTSDTWQVMRLVVNRRMVFLAITILVASVTVAGLSGIVLWLGCVVGYFLCFVPADLHMFLKFKRQLAASWRGVMESPIADDLPVESAGITEVKKAPVFACKIATRAISKVGLLSPTRANKLVYQNVCLGILESMNVRYVDRVRVLPYAIAACLCRPEEVQDTERCIEHLVSPTASL